MKEPAIGFGPLWKRKTGMMPVSDSSRADVHLSKADR